MTTVLQARKRTEFRRSSLTKIREEGKIPAIIYGTKMDSVPIVVQYADLIKTLQIVGRNGVIALDLNGNKQNVVLSDFQEDPLKNRIIHADFLAVDMSTEITVDVRVVLVGDAAGEKDGGVLQQPLHQVSLTATPNNIPQSIEIDISTLQVGETIAIKDITAEGKYMINHHDEEVIVSILPPKQEEEINSGEEQEAGTPENEEGRETEASNE
ncbi:50S ribosomal protein L25/general stress protein Ctc [Bacillus aquiflavi]|uniref:Large ribosomal subunit protein bL25 n=1 Tax=Bacillus aquiflavi TaxID=2672567 RepID=A0A6B3VNR0_9BACI|nr:50S ribosomal protein L25/general stress protein Ctc [Bacillus aquiflavi]MBA4535554.1 50S ribosomal protein L25/general stress protein Ctc [Bacillus aquiflavi]NEY79930.1 50S ribosomal protein L25/general stress protein Ctc [Bacillus aquiflavi]UAC48230.1 50S ribosomal protein L25/general stress protein Ctc [Bacillus aquiflavi]